MPLRSLLKRWLFGAGEQPRPLRLRFGLLAGLRYTLNPANSLQRVAGLDEREVLPWMRRFTRPAAVAVDVGGAEGWYALYFATRPGLRRVLTFEPDGALRRRIAENLALNQPTLRAPVEARAEFVGDRTEAGWCRLDDVLAGEEGPFVMKVDVDGGELDVLHGARETLAARPCRLVVETHSVKLERSCLDYLRQLGYRTRIVPNAWYRRFLPEARQVEQNRWLVAWRW